MKSTAVLSCLAFALAQIANAQEVITPTNRIDLFNGRDFTGWTFCMKDNAVPRQTWSVTNGVIHCTGQPVGFMRTLQNYRDYEFHVVWRFVKVAPNADNSGVFVHMQLPDRIWPACVQVQGRHDHQGDLYLMAGAESREHKGMEAGAPIPMRGPSAEKPVGEWNTCVTVCSGNGVKACVNGKLMNETTECTLSSGAVGIQCEGGELEIRKMFLEPLESS